MRLSIYIFVMLFIAAIFATPGKLRIKGEPKRLLGDEKNARMNPIWSPDGSMIAFSSPSYSGLWVMEQDGSNVRQISAELSAGYGFEWTTDSQALIYRVARYDGYRRFNAVKMFDFSTGDSKQITDYRLKLSGTVYWNGAAQEVLLLSKNGIEQYETGITASSSNKNTARKIVCFMQNLKMYLYDSTDEAVITIDPLPGSRYLDAKLAPDGKYIAFQVIGGNMFVIGTEGNNLVNLGRGYRPRWSPDGRQLVYMICEDDGHQFTSSDLYIIDRNGENKQQITNTTGALEMNPVWSPDGTKIAYDRMDQGAIYVMEVLE